MQTVTNFICGICHEPVVSEEFADGSAQWSCPCGKTYGWRGTEGALDLGIIRETQESENNLAMFHETFEGLVAVGVNHSEGDLTRLLPDDEQ